MYETFFKLRGKPFQLNPDPRFFYGSKGHKRAMAYLDYGLSLGFGPADLMKALLLTQFVAFPAALAFGWLGRRIGARRGMFLALLV